MSTKQGLDVVAAGAKRDLSPAQREAAGEGDLLAKEPGAHAEVTAINAALENGLEPFQIVTSRDMCPDCQTFIEDMGGEIAPNLKSATFPK